jgi:hypothetical protein
MRWSFPRGVISGVANTVLAFDCKCGGRLDCDAIDTICEIVEPEPTSELRKIPAVFQSDFVRAVVFE